MTDQTKNTNPNRTVIITSGIALLIILTGIGVYAFQGMNKPAPATTNNQSVADKANETMMKNGTSISNSSSMQNDDKMMAKDTMSKPGEYLPYATDLVSTKASKGDVVLFFNASWCPSCQATVKDINSKLDKIPTDLTILSADYDKEIALRQKYGVTMQHTFVKVDKDGNLIKKMPSLSTLENIAAFAKSN